MSVAGSHERPAGGLELYAWLFMRISGVLLLLLALGHLFIMHVFNSIHVIDYDFVANRYQHLFWRFYDLALLWLALLHGLNGFRMIADDYLRPGARGIAVRLLFAGGLFFLVLGSWVIFAFQPVAGG